MLYSNNDYMFDRANLPAPFSGNILKFEKRLLARVQHSVVVGLNVVVQGGSLRRREGVASLDISLTYSSLALGQRKEIYISPFPKGLKKFQFN